MANFPLNFQVLFWTDIKETHVYLKRSFPMNFRSPGQYSSYTFRCSLIIMKKP